MYKNGENQLKAKTKLIIALIVTAILIVYGIELGIRLLTVGARIEYFIVAMMIIALLLLVDLRLSRNYKREKAE